MTCILGIDVGGTFTDFVYYDPSEDKLLVWKTLSTPQDPGKGIIDGLQNQQIGEVDYLRFGTTIATNAILERNGATVAFVTTSGFKDVPFIQRGKRQSHYDINWIKSKPLVKRRHCFEIEERVTPREGVYKALDENQVRNVARKIGNDSEIESIAICLLCSYVIPDHEIRVKEIFREEIPDRLISISYDLLPKWKEHERSSTTIADAYLKPLVSENLEKLGNKLSKAKDIKRVSVIKSNGGEEGKTGATLFKKSDSERWETAVEAYGKVSPSKYSNIPMRPGDRVRVLAPGGGGYGDPSERQKSDVLSDLEEGYDSKADAIRLYSLDDND